MIRHSSRLMQCAMGAQASARASAAATRPLAQTAHAAAAAASAMNDRAQAARSRHVVLSLVGTDRVGIVSEFTAAALRHGTNVEETRMARLGGEFCIIGMLSVPADKDPKALATAFQGAFPGFNISCRQTEVLDEPVAPEQVTTDLEEWNIELEGPDQMGIVAAVTEELAKVGCNIHELQTETVPAPFAGFALFKMEIDFGVAAPSIDDVAKAMSGIESRFGVSVIMSKGTGISSA